MRLEGRQPDQCIVEDDIQRVDEFSKEMLGKWQRGREKHGVTVKIDPLEEAMKECVDLANYAMETYFRIKELKSGLETSEGDRSLQYLKGLLEDNPKVSLAETIHFIECTKPRC